MTTHGTKITVHQNEWGTVRITQSTRSLDTKPVFTIKNGSFIDVTIIGPNWDQVQRDLDQFISTLPIKMDYWTIGLPSTREKIGFVLTPVKEYLDELKRTSWVKGVPTTVKLTDGSTIPVYLERPKLGLRKRIHSRVSHNQS
jgi:hypothetical protein